MLRMLRESDEWRLRGRLDALYHVQLEVLERPNVPKTPTDVPVRGRVAHVFRADEWLRAGDEILVSIYVGRPDDEPIPGAAPRLDVDELDAAKFIEAFLRGTPPDCRVCRSQIAVIPELRAEPFLRVLSLEEIQRRYDQRAAHVVVRRQRK